MRTSGGRNEKIVVTTGLLLSSMSASAAVITEFLNNDNDPQWRVVNDNVMGGRSLGDFVVQDEIL